VTGRGGGGAGRCWGARAPGQERTLRGRRAWGVISPPREGSLAAGCREMDRRRSCGRRPVHAPAAAAAAAAAAAVASRRRCAARGGFVGVGRGTRPRPAAGASARGPTSRRARPTRPRPVSPPAGRSERPTRAAFDESRSRPLLIRLPVDGCSCKTSVTLVSATRSWTALTRAGRARQQSARPTRRRPRPRRRCFLISASDRVVHSRAILHGPT